DRGRASNDAAHPIVDPTTTTIVDPATTIAALAIRSYRDAHPLPFVPLGASEHHDSRPFAPDSRLSRRVALERHHPRHHDARARRVDHDHGDRVDPRASARSPRGAAT